MHYSLFSQNSDYVSPIIVKSHFPPLDGLRYMCLKATALKNHFGGGNKNPSRRNLDIQ